VCVVTPVCAQLWRGVEPNPMRIATCAKTGDIVEPYLCPQWYACDVCAPRDFVLMCQRRAWQVDELQGSRC
jgi:valyl-tRNA synthetase